MYDSEINRWFNLDPLLEEYCSWSPYNYTLNNPIRYIDPDGQQPRTPFRSPNAAALNWGHYYNGKSILIGREMASSIYTDTRGSRTVYMYNEATVGDEHGVVPSSAPDGKNRVAVIHSHGDYESEYNNNEFSRGDKGYAEKHSIDIYVATTDGSLKIYDSTTDAIATISTDMPSDPKDPERRNTNDPTDVPLEDRRAKNIEEQNKKPELQFRILEKIVKWVF
jgi:hypothetical protein